MTDEGCTWAVSGALHGSLLTSMIQLMSRAREVGTTPRAEVAVRLVLHAIRVEYHQEFGRTPPPLPDLFRQTNTQKVVARWWRTPHCQWCRSSQEALVLHKKAAGVRTNST